MPAHQLQNAEYEPPSPACVNKFVRVEDRYHAASMHHPLQQIELAFGQGLLTLPADRLSGRKARVLVSKIGRGDKFPLPRFVENREISTELYANGVLQAIAWGALSDCARDNFVERFNRFVSIAMDPDVYIFAKKYSPLTIRQMCPSGSLPVFVACYIGLKVVFRLDSYGRIVISLLSAQNQIAGY